MRTGTVFCELLMTTDRPLPFISVIIPVFNDGPRLRECLGALADQTYPKDHFEVVVVDNSPGADQALVGLPEEFSTLTLTVAHQPRRGSYAARNLGLTLAQGPAIAFTDSDCIPAADWLERGAQHLSQHPDCGLVAGRIKFFFQSPESPSIAEIYDSLHLLTQQKYIEKYHFGATANVFTFKDVFANVGAFNDTLQSGGDSEWGKRVFAAGYEQIYAEDVVIAHPARTSFRALRKKVARITEGDYYLNDTDDWPLSRFLADVLIDFKPHIKYFFDLAEKPQVQGFRKQLGCYLMYIYLRHLKSWTRLRLYMRNVTNRYHADQGQESE